LKTASKLCLNGKQTPEFAFFILRIVTFCLLLMLFCSCNNKADTDKIAKTKPGKQFTILTIDRIRQTGFLKRIIPTFEQASGCKVEVISCAGSSELMEYIKDPKSARKYDIILGIDNSFFNDSAAYEAFSASTVLQKHPVNSASIIDPQNRVIPYGYGYLAMLYNEQKIPQPPESFGELQDARFLNQIVICDPRNSGIGRAALYWTIALFGNDGYQQFWKSIKKNIYTGKDTWQDALQTLNSQACGMAIGFTTTPAWILETQTNPVPIKASLMKEGSFLYIEAAAIPIKAKRKALSEAFLTYLLSPEIQKYVAYDLGIYPANESTPLPTQFSFAPFTAVTVNDNLKPENPLENLTNWLDFWSRLFSLSPL